MQVVTNNEKAFYDALAANESAVKALGDDKLKVIAAKLITQVGKSVTIDWTLREGARAKIRVMVSASSTGTLPARFARAGGVNGSGPGEAAVRGLGG